MQCNKPFWLRFYKIMVPCGKCLACKRARAREWTARIVHEASFYEASSFVTLTYDDEHLPADMDRCKRDAVLFIKRLRKDIEPRRIKYFLVSEYGGRFGRIHLHAMIFGIHPKEKNVIAGAWGLGLVHLGTVTPESAYYITSYLLKAEGGGPPFPEPSGSARGEEKGGGGGKQPFRLSSQGIGRRWAKENRSILERDLGLTMRGTKQGLPRYYARVLDLEPEALAERAREANEAANEWLAQRGHGYEYVGTTYETSEETLRRAAEIYLDKRRSGKN